MTEGKLTIVPVGESALLVRFGNEISQSLHEKVVTAFHKLRGLGFSLHPAYSSILVEFDALQVTADEVKRLLREKLQGPSPSDPLAGKTIEIPVVYDGPDLAEVASIHGISTEKVIELHSQARYRVFFLGFQPGFAYLGTLSERLATPRLATPRIKVPAGSVGIAGRQTGVYPLASPGGWRLIGRTELSLFDPKRDEPTLLGIGDEVVFKPL